MNSYFMQGDTSTFDKNTETIDSCVIQIRQVAEIEVQVTVDQDQDLELGQIETG